MNALQDRLIVLRREVAEVDVHEAARRHAGGAVLVDVRDLEEWASGGPTGAVHLPRGTLELHIEAAVPDPRTPLLLICAAGTRSLLAAADLRALGYTGVASVAGGVDAWRTAGLPMRVPAGLDADSLDRYARHLRLPEVGAAGQARLLASRVLCVGAGGIGAPALLYLAAAGVGRLTVVDDDRVERSNLQRQIIHTDGRVGVLKTESARAALLALNPRLQIDVHPTRLDATNVDALVAGQAVVVDGTDNFATRYLINDACVRLGVPNVHGSVHRFEGQVAVFHPPQGPCYRCLYPAPPPAALLPACGEVGVLGVVPGVVGVIQAAETLKLLLGLGDVLIGRLLQVDLLGPRFHLLRLPRDPACAICGPLGTAVGP